MRERKPASPDTLIAEVHAADVAAAREILREAIKVARDGWLCSQAVADAMIQELVELSAQGASPERASAYLRGVAALLDRSARPPVN